MPERISSSPNSLLMRVVAKWVKPEVLPSAPASLIDPDLPVVYILESGGIADTTALAILCDQHGLPHPRTEVVYQNLKLRRRTVSLRRTPPFGIGKSRLTVPKALQRIVQEAQANAEELTECQIVPVSVYWGRAPQREDSILRQMFSETWEMAGSTRKLFATLLHGRHTLVSISEPLSLIQLVESSDGIDLERKQRKLSRILRVHFRQRRIATIGPDLSHRRMLINHVLADNGLKQAIEKNLTSGSLSHQKLLSKARGYAQEIAADVSYGTIRVLQKVLTRLWTHLYDGVEFTGVQRLQAVADGREIVYVPCHRSHIDYLLLSYILYTNGYSLPHIAAGVNLNMPIVGGILRRGGAFFLRRSFAGNPLYAATFNAYLKELLQRGHALEYFIEGGRSRSGRLLPPKGGMLAMTVHAYLQDARRPLIFVPVYFGYERLLEGRAFTSELTGGKKQKESVFGLLKSLKTLREDYGRVHVNIGTPIAADDVLNHHHQNWRSETIQEQRPSWIKPVVDELGETIMRRINQAASVTPISLVATALLATPKASLGRSSLQTLIRTYHRLISGIHKNTEVIMPTMPAAAMLEHAMSLGYLELHQDKLGDVVSVKATQVAPITYFRNNIQHLLALPAAIACTFSNRATLTDQRIRELLVPAYPFLRAELFLSDEADEAAIENALKVMQSLGLIEFADGKWRRTIAGSTEAITLMRLAQSIMPTMERYYLNTAVLASAGTHGLSQKQFSEHCEAVAIRLSRTHGRDNTDWYDKNVLERFVTTMEATGGIIKNDGGVLTLNTEVLHRETDARLLLNEQTRHAILAAVQGFGDHSFSHIE